MPREHSEVEELERRFEGLVRRTNELERRLNSLYRKVVRLMTIEEDVKADFDAFVTDVNQHLDTLENEVKGNATATAALTSLRESINAAKATVDARVDPGAPPPPPPPPTGP